MSDFAYTLYNTHHEDYPVPSTEPTPGWKDGGAAYVTIKSGSVIERHTPRGPEGEITFIAPSHVKSELLSTIFGEWRMVQGSTWEAPDSLCVGSTGRDYQCWELVMGPTPFPQRERMTSSVNLTGEKSTRYLPVLYPDSYSMKPVDNSMPVKIHAASGNQLKTWGDLGDMGAGPLHYQCKASDNPIWESGLIEIKVKYRWKITGLVSTDLFKGHNHGNAENRWSVTNQGDKTLIPRGTYIEYRTRSDQEIQEIPSKTLKIKPDAWFSQSSTNAEYLNPDATPLSAGGSKAKDTDIEGNHHANRELKDAWAGVPVNTNLIEVTWSNVPQVLTVHLEERKGTVNSGNFFGFPKEGLMFQGYDYEPMGDHLGQTVYSIRFRFISKTTPFKGMGHWADNSVVHGGQLGIWNRRWVSHPEKHTSTVAESCEEYNYWMKIVDATGKAPLKTSDFTDLFEYQLSSCQ